MWSMPCIYGPMAGDTKSSLCTFCVRWLGLSGSDISHKSWAFVGCVCSLSSRFYCITSMHFPGCIVQTVSKPISFLQSCVLHMEETSMLYLWHLHVNKNHQIIHRMWFEVCCNSVWNPTGQVMGRFTDHEWHDPFGACERQVPTNWRVHAGMLLNDEEVWGTWPTLCVKGRMLILLLESIWAFDTDPVDRCFLQNVTGPKRCHSYIADFQSPWDLQSELQHLVRSESLRG